MLKVGITSEFFYPDPNRKVYGKKSLSYVENDMANFLGNADVFPILIPDLKEEKLFPLLQELDGVLLQGGVDVCPESYNEEYLNKEKWPGDLYKDQYELKVIDYAFKNELPILGICRGFQILNVYFGGTLYQDLTLETGTYLQHRCADEYDKVNHCLEILPDSFLNSLYPDVEDPIINSIHHQGVKDLGKDLITEALSPVDKIIEAFRHKNFEDHFVYGVQWHPEFSHTLGDLVMDPQPLLNAFINSVKRKKDANN